MRPPAEQWQRTVRKLRRAVLRDEPGYYDMYENKGERFFARLYLHQIRRVLQAEGGPPPLATLDAGCQAGRLAVPLALEGHRVTGVDTSDLALRRAQQHVRAANRTLRLIRADLTRWLPTQAAGSYDVVLCTEVLYLRRNHRELLAALVRLLRPGGLCFISHRPATYYQLTDTSEGLIDGSYYNWQNRATLEALYPTLGVEVLAITPIGCLSGPATNPEFLDQAGQDRLFELELAAQAHHLNGGRYLLVSGRKIRNRQSAIGNP